MSLAVVSKRGGWCRPEMVEEHELTITQVTKTSEKPDKDEALTRRRASTGKTPNGGPASGVGVRAQRHRTAPGWPNGHDHHGPQHG
eukprot:254680-Rhodomonas_salina.1